jgi:uncharacterized protein (TIGR00730 family)
MDTIGSICVYCGSSTGDSDVYRDAAARLGRILAEAGIQLVYGGGRIGLMGVLADAVLARGGRVIGIIPEHLQTLEVGHDGISELRIVSSMHERKQLMFELADGFVVLPGGLGTLDETLEMVTWSQLGLHDKPIVLVDQGGYWRPLIDLLDAMVGAGFVRPENTAILEVVNDVDQVLGTLAAAPAPRIAAREERF